MTRSEFRWVLIASLLHGYDLDYVFYGPPERALGDRDVAEAQYLIAVHREEGYVLYRIAIEESSP